MMDTRNVLITVTGKVQGVFFRAAASEAAKQNGICGYAKNMPDGSVEMKAQGNRDSIETFIAWAKQGPPGAKVIDLEVSEQHIEENLEGFITI